MFRRGAAFLLGLGAALAIAPAAAQAAPIFVAGPSPAAPFAGTSINFEGFAEGTLIDNQYAGLGVTFIQADGGRPQIDNLPPLYGFTPNSATAVLTGSTEGGATYPTTASLKAVFTSPVSSVAAYLSDTSPLGDKTVTAFGAGDVVLESQVVTAASQPSTGTCAYDPSGTPSGCGVFVGFSRPTADIVSIQFGPSSAADDAFAIDDLLFIPAGSTCDASLAARGCWRFDETSGTTANDSSTFNNDGTYLGSVTLGVPGEFNTAVSLDSADDAVRVADANSLDVGDSFSLEGWIKRASAAASQTMFNKGANGFQLTVMNAGSSSQVFLRKTNVSTIARSTAPVPADGAYHHIVATKNGTAVAIYVDGVAGTVPVSAVQVIQNTTFPLAFGPGVAQAPASYDEFAVYDAVLTPAQVAARFAAGP